MLALLPRTLGCIVSAYYNDTDEYCAAWLRNLIAAGLIAPGDVDTRSIAEVQPEDVAPYTQCHFFAGLGGWSYAARLAGWPDTRSLWTGSCPCQPFSVAGRGKGVTDARHLWPDFFRLIDGCRPAVVFGEQVSNAAGERTRLEFDVQQMWYAEAIHGLLPGSGVARQFEWLSLNLQGVLPRMAAELQDYLEGAEVGYFSRLQTEESRQDADYRRALSGETVGHPLQSGSVRTATSGSDRSREMRTVGNSLPARWWENVGQPLARSDSARIGLRDHERKSGSLFLERDDEHLGAGADSTGSGSHQVEAGGGSTEPLSEMGEEPEGSAVTDWLDGVQSDLDSIGYSSRAVDIPACSVNAPHIRNRLYWLAHTKGIAEREPQHQVSAEPRRNPRIDAGGSGERFGGLGHSNNPQRRPDAERRVDVDDRSDAGRGEAPGGSQLAGEAYLGMEHTARLGRGEGRTESELRSGRGTAPGASSATDGMGYADLCLASDEGLQRSGQLGGPGGDTRRHPGFWDEWSLVGPDPTGKYRRVKPGVRLLAAGIPARVSKLRALGNAIVPEIAAEVIRAYMETYA